MFWACLLNVVCVLFVCVTWHEFGVDLSHGSSRDLLGIVFLIGGGVAGLSTDALLEFLFTPLQDSRFTQGEQRSPLGCWWDRVMNVSMPRWPSRRSQADRVRSFSCYGVIYVSVLVILGIMQVGLMAYEWTRFGSRGAKVGTILTTEKLSPSHRGWALKDDAQWHHDSAEDDGGHALQWMFQTPGHEVLMAIDYPSKGWRELRDRYVSRGWEMREESTHTVEGWQFVESHWQKYNGEHGFLLFCLCTEHGEVVRHRGDLWSSGSPSVLGKIQQGEPLADGSFFEIQAWVRYGGTLDREEEADVRQVFLKLREVLREELEAASSKPTLVANS